MNSLPTIRIKQIRQEVHVFEIPDTPINRRLIEQDRFEELIYDEDGYYKNLTDSYGTDEEYKVEGLD